MQLTGPHPRSPRSASVRGHDDGAVTMLVAVLLAGGVLLGMAALTVDVGLIHAERRELQNGADAGGAGRRAAVRRRPRRATRARAGWRPRSPTATPTTTPRAGDRPSAERPSVPGCPARPGPTLTRCRARSRAGCRDGSRSRTATETTGGQTLLPPRSPGRSPATAATPAPRCAPAHERRGDAVVCAPRSPGDDLAVRVEPDDEQRRRATHRRRRTPTGYPTGYERAIYLHDTTRRQQLPGRTVGLGPPGRVRFARVGRLPATGQRHGLGRRRPGGLDGERRAAASSRHRRLRRRPDHDADLRRDQRSQRLQRQLPDRRLRRLLPHGYSHARRARRTPSPPGDRLCSGSDKCLYGWFTQALVPVGSLTGGGRGHPARRSGRRSHRIRATHRDAGTASHTKEHHAHDPSDRRGCSSPSSSRSSPAWPCSSTSGPPTPRARRAGGGQGYIAPRPSRPAPPCGRPWTTG